MTKKKALVGVGAQLAEIRSRIGLTQAEAAQAIFGSASSQPRICALERGGDALSLRTLRLLLATYSMFSPVEPNDLFRLPGGGYFEPLPQSAVISKLKKDLERRNNS